MSGIFSDGHGVLGMADQIHAQNLGLVDFELPIACRSALVAIGLLGFCTNQRPGQRLTTYAYSKIH